VSFRVVPVQSDSNYELYVVSSNIPRFRITRYSCLCPYVSQLWIGWCSDRYTHIERYEASVLEPSCKAGGLVGSAVSVPGRPIDIGTLEASCALNFPVVTGPAPAASLFETRGGRRR